MKRLLPVVLLLAACGGKESSPPPSGQGEQPQPVETPAVRKAVDPTSVGQLRGVVAVTGAVEANGTLVLNADAWCKNHYDTPPMDERLLVADGKLQNAFVWIESGLEGYEFNTPAEKKVLDQNGCIFGPRVSGVMVGQALTAKNSDPVLHNVHSKPSENRGRNIALPSVGSERDFVFDKPEIMVPIVCDVHPWMRAFVGVVPHPYYGITGADGRFELGNLPPGDYTLGVWHEELGTRSVSFELAAGQELELSPVEFTSE